MFPEEQNESQNSSASPSSSTSDTTSNPEQQTHKDKIVVKSEPKESEENGAFKPSDNSESEKEAGRLFKRKFIEVWPQDTGFSFSPLSPKNHHKRLHPDPMDLLTRAFPKQNRQVLELILQGCGGNIVQAIECVLENQDSNGHSVSHPSLPIISSVASLSREPNILTPNPMFYRPEFLHTRTHVPFTYRPPPPLLKPNPQLYSCSFTSAINGSAFKKSEPSEKPKDLEFCTNCGRKAENHDNFCASCGQKLFIR